MKSSFELAVKQLQPKITELNRLYSGKIVPPYNKVVNFVFGEVARNQFGTGVRIPATELGTGNQIEIFASFSENGEYVGEEFLNNFLKKIATPV